MTTLRFSILVLVLATLWLGGCPSKDDVHDGDGDGFPAGSGPGLDCDDTNDDINPDRDEAANYVDDDCDDLVDEGTEYEDLDGDGYITDIAGGSDCDDADAAIHPDVEEVCRDGKDQNCDEEQDPCLFVGEMSNGSVVPSRDGELDGDNLAQSLVGPGDVTGDGLADVALTVPGRGEVWIYSAERLLSTPNAPPDVTITGGTDDLTLGPAGDLDGDGVADLFAAAPQPSETGAVWFFPGPLNDTDMGHADLVADGEEQEQLGAALGWICDEDGAFCGLVVGVPEMDGAPDSLGQEGGLVFVRQGEGGMSSTRIAGLDSYAQAGAAFATGDFDGDGDDDLAVGATSARRDPLDPVSETTGGVYVIFDPDLDALEGGFSGADDDLAWLEGVEAEGRTGEQVTNAGDMDGDGIDDLAISSPAIAGGRVDLVLGPVESVNLKAADATWLGCERGDQAGAALAGGDDLDEDGVVDLLIGAPLADDKAGSVYLVHWPEGADSTYSLSVADATWVRADGSHATLFGQTLAPLGDTNGDGYPDVAMGAPGAGVGNLDDAGTFFVLFGTGL